MDAIYWWRQSRRMRRKSRRMRRREMQEGPPAVLGEAEVVRYLWSCGKKRSMFYFISSLSHTAGWSHNHRIPIEWFPIGKSPITENHSSIGQYSSVGQYCEDRSIGQYLSIGRYCKNCSSIGQYLPIGKYLPISQSDILAGRIRQTNDNMRQLIGHTNQQLNSDKISIRAIKYQLRSRGMIHISPFLIRSTITKV